MKGSWPEFSLSEDATHHVFQGFPAYGSRFHGVQKFHEPGLAPVHDTSGAYHINPDGRSAYPERYSQTFGFYEHRAAVSSGGNWFHILPDGSPSYSERHAWCGNYREGRCAVRTHDGGYFHIGIDGNPVYGGRYRYVGDFRDGHAVVQGEDGRHTHIDAFGNLLHGRWFEDLDVFHKGHARARDSHGWHHVDMSGKPLYGERFRNVEPFYNGQARVEGLDGSLLIVDESGAALLPLRPSQLSSLEILSSDMVGAWRTQTIRAAAELGVFEILPATPEVLEGKAGLAPAMGARLLRALLELGLVSRDAEGLYRPTERGSILLNAHSHSLAEAAVMWGQEHYTAWMGITDSLQTGGSSFQRMHGANIFDWMKDRPGERENFHAALSSYACHDYRSLPERIDFTAHRTLLDAGGGKGELMFGLLRACPSLRGVVMDRPEVVESARAPGDVASRCQFVAGDLFAKWPVQTDSVILARVLHDWPDAAALQILRIARAAIEKSGTLYVVEMVLDEVSGNGGLLDLNMLVMTGGTERTEGQFRLMLKEAGFQMQRLVPMGSVSSVIQATPS